MELNRWKNHFMSDPPESPAEAIKRCDATMFPNNSVLLEIACTLPVTSCECESSFRAFRRLNNYTRASMGRSQLSNLQNRDTLVSSMTREKFGLELPKKTIQVDGSSCSVLVCFYARATVREGCGESATDAEDVPEHKKTQDGNAVEEEINVCSYKKRPLFLVVKMEKDNDHVYVVIQGQPITHCSMVLTAFLTMAGALYTFQLPHHTSIAPDMSDAEDGRQEVEKEKSDKQRLLEKIKDLQRRVETDNEEKAQLRKDLEKITCEKKNQSTEIGWEDAAKLSLAVTARLGPRPLTSTPLRLSRRAAVFREEAKLTASNILL
ncbi:Hypp6785 [Branchiostoma lanceolatum]|uniref:Hypp6785 protein n=1 Tax=Branchiostoma lanceolatum TaxID=7740 RepID=A0A8J9YVH3_BRALA|nr:Hypp6785 [Branchiostoma lanceolatum]